MSSLEASISAAGSRCESYQVVVQTKGPSGRIDNMTFLSGKEYEADLFPYLLTVADNLGLVALDDGEPTPSEAQLGGMAVYVESKGEYIRHALGTLMRAIVRHASGKAEHGTIVTDGRVKLVRSKPGASASGARSRQKAADGLKVRRFGCQGCVARRLILVVKPCRGHHIRPGGTHRGVSALLTK